MSSSISLNRTKQAPQNGELQNLQALLQHDIDARAEEIKHLEQITKGMNGSEPPQRQSLELDHSIALANGSGVDGGEDETDATADRGGINGSYGSFGRAQTGKSGRVIERLMAECDRLRRDLNVQTSAREEERKSKEALRASRDSLQSTNDILVHQTNIDKRSLEKKDRKIEELKGEVTNERALRLQAERNLRELMSQNDAELQKAKAEALLEVEKRTKAITQYDALAAGWKNLDEGYKLKLEKLYKRLEALAEDRLKDQALLKRLEITIEQQRQEIDKMRLAKAKITQKFEDCMGEAENGIEEMRQKMRQAEDNAERTLDLAKTTLNELRYALNIKKNVKSLYPDEDDIDT